MNENYPQNLFLIVAFSSLIFEYLVRMQYLSFDGNEMHFSLAVHMQFLLKVDNRNTRAKCGICSKLTIKTPERRHWLCYGVFIVNF